MKTFLKIPMVLLLVIFLYTASASALPLPAADFGGVFSVDTKTGTVGFSNVKVFNVIYNDGSITDSNADDSVIGAAIGTGFEGWNFNLDTHDLTIDFDATNDFNIGNFLTGTLYDYKVSALEGVSGYQVNALLNNMAYNAQGSTFMEQFELATSDLDLAQMISFEIHLGTFSDTVYVNSLGKVAPVPEPATMLLLGTGIAGITAVRRRKGLKYKK